MFVTKQLLRVSFFYTEIYFTSLKRSFRKIKLSIFFLYNNLYIDALSFKLMRWYKFYKNVNGENARVFYFEWFYIYIHKLKMRSFNMKNTYHEKRSLMDSFLWIFWKGFSYSICYLMHFKPTRISSIHKLLFFFTSYVLELLPIER